MTTTASYTTEWNHDLLMSRRLSTETVFSIQDRETDFARDTSDTEPFATDDEDGLEYEPVTASEHEALFEDTSGSEDEIIKTDVIVVAIGNDGDLELADSESTERNESDIELKRHDFKRCAQCNGRNTNPVYRYCYKCFTMRKNFFPPRPRKNRKKSKGKLPASERTMSMTSSASCLSQGTDVGYHSAATVLSGVSSQSQDSARARLKRRASSERPHGGKTPRCNSDSGTETDTEPVQPLVKTVSDPLVSQIDRPIKLTKKAIANTLLSKMDAKDLCMVCVSEPKSGVFVHGRVAHICCCYRCAVKVWRSTRRCPVCNCRVSNVLRAVVM